MKKIQTIFISVFTIATLAVAYVQFIPAAYAAPAACTDGTDGCIGEGTVSDTTTPKPVAGDGGKCTTSIIDKKYCTSSKTLESNGIWGLLIFILNIMTAGVGLLAVGGIIYGSIMYATAEDKTDQINKAKDIIFNVVIGLVAYVMMYAFLNFIIPGGIFT